MASGALFTTTRAPRPTGLRNRFSAFRATEPKSEQDSPVAELQVVHEDGTERIIEQQSDGEEEEDGLYHSYSSMSSSASGGSNGRDVGDDPAADHHNVNAEATGVTGHRRLSSPPRPARFREPSGTFNQRREEGSRQRRASTSVAPTASTSSTSWFGFDLSILVALVSPVGNLLTGGDHIKNVILVLLLIYYLHQLVEVPWTLYRMSVPRRKALPDSAAHAQLRSLEIFYLTLTVISPFLGSTLLRYVARAITGRVETLSWFSTSLFVLATGVRPWSHLIERLKNRSQALHSILERDHRHEGTGEVGEGVSEEEIKNMRADLNALDNRISDVAEKTDNDAHDLSDHLDEIIDTVEIKLRRHRAEQSRIAQAQDLRIAALEAQVLALNAAVRRGEATNAERNRKIIEAQLFLHWLILLPWNVTRTSWNFVCKAFGRGTETSSYNRRRISRSHSSPSLRSPLASIPEEDQFAHNGLDYFEHDSNDSFIRDGRRPSRGVFGSLLYATATILFSPLWFALRIATFLVGLPMPRFGFFAS